MLNSHLSKNSDSPPLNSSILERHHSLQNVLAEIIAEAPDTAITRIIQSICTYTDWDFGEVWNIDANNNCLVHQANWHVELARYPKFEEISRQITFSPGLGLPGRVWKTTSPLWIPDVIE